MSFYPKEVIEQVRSLNEIVNLISSYLPLKQNGNNYFGLCPFHSEKSPSFSVNPERQIYHCFGCGASGNVITFIMQMENYNFVEAIKFLANRANYNLPDSQDKKSNKELAYKNKLIKINTDAARYFYHSLIKSRFALNYLFSRNISKITIKKFGLGYDDNKLYNYLIKMGYKPEDIIASGLVIKNKANKIFDKFSYRIIFPIFDIYGKVIGFGGRTLRQDLKPKYLNSTESVLFNKSMVLYNINLACKFKSKKIILTEGYMDAISLYQAGFENVCACLGTAFNIKHARLIKNHFDNVILLFDSDAPGIKAVRKAISVLNSVNLETKVLLLKDAKDPDEYLKKFGCVRFKSLIENNCVDSVEFEINLAKKKYDLKILSDKIKFAKEAIKIVLDLNDKIKQEVYIKTLAQTLKISEDVMLNEIRNQKTTCESTIININKKKTRSESLIEKAKSDIINIIVENPRVYLSVKKYLQPDELGDGIHKKLLEIISFMLEEDSFINISPAELINYFDTPIEQSTVAKIFDRGASYDDLQKALSDIIKIIKRYNLSQKIYNSNDVNELAGLMQEKKLIDMLNILI